MTTARTLPKASGLGTLSWDSAGTQANMQFNRAFNRQAGYVLVDKGPERYGGKAEPLGYHFRAEIRDNGNGIYTVSTCGNDLPGTRHRDFGSLHEAIENLLGWLDRRVRVEEAS